MSPIKEGSDNYLEITIKPSAGILYPLSSTGNIQYRIAKTDWSNFNQANDYSYLSNAGMVLNEKVSVYYHGQLISGTEPSVIPNARISATSEEPSLILEAMMIGNPITEDKGTVEIRGTQGLVTTISLINMSGSEVLSHTLEHPNNNERFTFTTDKLSNGIYLLGIISGNKVCVLKVMKQ